MTTENQFILGEFRRTLDDRFRVSLPAELLADGDDKGSDTKGNTDFVLAKERPGAISLWHAGAWQEKLDSGVNLVKSKIQAGRLEGRIDQVQVLGRLLSTRHRAVQLAGRGRLLIPEGFREFLGVEPGSDVLIVGAAVCVEIWRPDAWISYLDQQIPAFGSLLDELSA